MKNNSTKIPSRGLKIKQKAALAAKDTAAVHTIIDSSLTGWAKATIGVEAYQEVETDLLKVRFSTKGGQPTQVSLKKYQRADGSPVTLIHDGSDQFSYPVNTAANQSAQAADIYFQFKGIQKDAAGNQTITFEVAGNNGETITHEYVLKPDSYLIDFNLKLNGIGTLLTQQQLKPSMECRCPPAGARCEIRKAAKSAGTRGRWRL